MTITWQKIITFEQLSNLQYDWSALNHRSNNDCLFTSPIWLLNWYKVYWKKTWQLHCFAVFDEKRLIAFFPFYFQTIPSFISQKHLFFLGQGESEKAEVASEYLDVLVEKSALANIMKNHQDHIAVNKFDLFTARAIHKNSNIANIFWEHKQFMGYQYCLDKTKWCINHLSKNNKNRYKRSKNQLAKLKAEFLWAEPEDYDFYWQKMKIFHQQRWQNKNQIGAFAEHQFNQFHQQLFTPYCHDTLPVKMSLLTINGDVVAINYYLLSGETLYFYQSGWDEAQCSQLSPGFALHLWSIENSFERVYDFMLGDVNDSYKLKFKTNKVPLYKFSINIKPIKHLFFKILNKLITN